MVKKRGASPGDIRKNNIEFIIELLRQGPLTYSQIEESVKLSNAAVFTIIKEMYRRNIILKSPIPSNTSGRKADLIELNPNYSFFIVVDFGSEEVNMRVCDFVGSVRMRKNYGAEHIIVPETLSAIIADMKVEIGSEMYHSAFRQIVVITAGKYNTKHNKFIFAQRFLKFGDINLKEQFEKEFNIPIVLKNGMQLAILAEKNYGLKEAVGNNFMYLFIDDGTGGALMLDGEVYEGSFGMAGEIGFFGLNPTDSDSFFPSEKTITYNESFSIIALLRAYKNLKKETINWDEFCALYKNGDKDVVSIVKKTTGALAHFLWSMAEFLDIDDIVIAGQIQKLGDSFIEALLKILLPNPTNHPINIRFAKIQNDFYVLGAIYLGTRALSVCD